MEVRACGIFRQIRTSIAEKTLKYVVVLHVYILHTQFLQKIQYYRMSTENSSPKTGKRHKIQQNSKSITMRDFIGIADLKKLSWFPVHERRNDHGHWFKKQRNKHMERTTGA